jgi:uncharacterized repeat protein (TIGR03803 family)
MPTTANDWLQIASRMAPQIAVAGTLALVGLACEAKAASPQKVLYNFTGGSDGGQPNSGVITDASGNLYGTTYSGGSKGLGTVFELLPPTTAGGSWTEQVLYSFQAFTDAGEPTAGVIADASGVLYGMTPYGGTAGQGAVYSLTPPAIAGAAWTETILYSFKGGADGAYPFGGLVSDATGALYGTTNSGGLEDPSCAIDGGCGTVFKLAPPAAAGGTWTETVLHRFTFANSKGALPSSDLTIDASGALYGTTEFGNYGAVNGIAFRLAPPAIAGDPWIETVLHAFAGGSDGATPTSTLIGDKSGALYGTTQTGGGTGCEFGGGCGTVFALAPPVTPGGTWTETILYSFVGGNDGDGPSAGLIAGKDGALYGTTEFGGTSLVCSFGYTGCGTVFRLAPPAAAGAPWTEQVLRRFNDIDGGDPRAVLTGALPATLYGTTYDGGTHNEGTIFKIELP